MRLCREMMNRKKRVLLLFLFRNAGYVSLSRKAMGGREGTERMKWGNREKTMERRAKKKKRNEPPSSKTQKKSGTKVTGRC